jgi:hypothetical protein
MFGWANASPRPAYGTAGAGRLIERCESCALGLVGGNDIDLADELGDAKPVEGPNRSSLQAALGAGGWAAIDPARRIYPTPAAAEPIAQRLGGHAARVRTPLSSAAIWGMWQTLVNAFTLGDNVISDARHRRLAPATGRQRAAMTLDLVVSVLVSVPLLIIAVLLEAGACLAGRGGIVRFSIE